MPEVLATALTASGVVTPFPIQAATLPDSLAGRDVLGRGRTGSGKTYAFVLAVLIRLAVSATPRRPGRPRALVLAPTRELATQILTSMTPLAEALSLRILAVFGGVRPGPQIASLKDGVDVLVVGGELRRASSLTFEVARLTAPTRASVDLDPAVRPGTLAIRIRLADVSASPVGRSPTDPGRLPARSVPAY